MKHLFFILSVLTFLFFCPVCAEGVCSTNVVTSEKTDTDINIVFIGNSITAGATLSDVSTQAPPAVCRVLVEKATGLKVNVFNGGHSGITTFGFMPGRRDFNKVVSAAQNLYRNNDGVVYFSIMLGTNDSACTTTEGAPVSPETYDKNLRTIIDSLISAVPACKILLNYPIWYSPNTHNGAKYLQEGLDRLHSYYPVIKKIAKEYKQVYTGSRKAWSSFKGENSLFTAEKGYSGTFYLHPNAQGAYRLAEIWTKDILKMIDSDGIDIKKARRKSMSSCCKK